MKLWHRFKRLNIWNKIAVIAALLAPFGILFTIIGLVCNLNHSEGKLDDILAEIKKSNKVDHEILKNKYPLGYSIFFVHLEDKVIYAPDEYDYYENISVDWTTAFVQSVDFKKGKICLNSPKIVYGIINFFDNIGCIPLIENRQYRVWIIGAPKKIDIMIENLLISKWYMISLMGIRESGI